MLSFYKQQSNIEEQKKGRREGEWAREKRKGGGGRERKRVHLARNVGAVKMGIEYKGT